jgi:hypothetical protein
MGEEPALAEKGPDADGQGRLQIACALMLIQSGSTLVTAIGLLAVGLVETEPTANILFVLTLLLAVVQAGIGVGLGLRLVRVWVAALVLEALSLLGTAIASLVFKGPPPTVAAALNNVALPLLVIAAVTPWRSIRKRSGDGSPSSLGEPDGADTLLSGRPLP